jgi:ubiquinone/menaquinone biosynthesis C-methylase UbiE
MESIWGNDEFVNALENQLQHEYSGSHDEMHDFGRISLVDAMTGVQNDDVILDIGCGDGDTLQRYHDAHYLVGLDISNILCKNAKKNVKNAEIILASMDDLPFKDDTFDKIIAVYSIIYSSSKEKAFAEISRVLKDKGTFVLYDPNKLSLRTFIRRINSLKLGLSGEVSNPRYLHHRIVSRQAFSFMRFKSIGKLAHLRVDSWCGVFSYHLILPKIFYPFVFGKLHYKRWGFIPGIKNFSDFFIIKFVKESPPGK